MKIELRFWRSWKEAKKRAAYVKELAAQGRVCATCKHCSSEYAMLWCGYWYGWTERKGSCHNWAIRYPLKQVKP